MSKLTSLLGSFTLRTMKKLARDLIITVVGVSALFLADNIGDLGLDPSVELLIVPIFLFVYRASRSLLGKEPER